MIDRVIITAIDEQVGKYSVIMISGSRQSGKTTLIRRHFAHLPYDVDPLSITGGTAIGAKLIYC